MVPLPARDIVQPPNDLEVAHDEAKWSSWGLLG